MLAALLFASLVIGQGREWPVMVYVPDAEQVVYSEATLSADVVGQIQEGAAYELATPFVGADGRWWLRYPGVGWVPVAINGWCPRERLGRWEPLR